MTRKRPLIFGEVLFDCFPDGREVLGGAPFNVAWNLQAFGRQPIFVSRVGHDPHGLQIRNTMTDWSMDTTYVQSDPDFPTGRVEISLQDGEPRFAILPNQAYDHIELINPELKETPAFLYHGSLALRSEDSRAVLTHLRRSLSCPVFLDVNLRKPWWSRTDVLAMIGDATWLKMNDSECRTLFPDNERPEDCGQMLLARFNLEAVFITMGSSGALSFSPNEGCIRIEQSESVRVVDTVGAGDAFSSVLLLGFLNDWPLRISLERAQEFASAVVGLRGATTMDRTFYQKLLNRWIQ